MKSSTAIIIFLFVMFFLAMGAAIYYFVMGRKDNKANAPKSNTTQSLYGLDLSGLFSDNSKDSLKDLSDYQTSLTQDIFGY